MDAPSAVAPQWFTLEFGAYYVLIALFFVRVVPDGMTTTVEACSFAWVPCSPTAQW